MVPGDPPPFPPEDLATREEVRRALADRSAIVADVLPRESYRRHHLPGAVSLPLTRLGELARRRLGRPAREVLVYCGGYT